jgi:hypothetical protein
MRIQYFTFLCIALITASCDALVFGRSSDQESHGQVLTNSPTVHATAPIPATLTKEPPKPITVEENLLLKLEWKSDIDLSPEEAILLAADLDLNFQDSDHKPVFDILTWEGNRVEIFEIQLQENNYLKYPVILDLPIYFAEYFGFALGDSIEVQEIYWIHFARMKLFGFSTTCKNLTSVGEDAIALGDRWGVYVCDEDQSKWHLFKQENPIEAFTFELPVDPEIANGFEPFWVDEDTLALDRGFRHRCLVSVKDPESPDIACSEFDLILGEFSPDGRYIEVRQAIDTIDSLPQFVGYMEADCIKEPSTCALALYPQPFGLSLGSLYLEEATWIPDGSGILYKLIQEDANTSFIERDTLLWMLNLSDGSFTNLAELDEPLNLLDFYQHAYAIWSPDGKRVILQNVNGIYTFDIRTKSLELLSDEGGKAIGNIRLR